MGVEPEARTGPSTGTNVSAYHRVCSRHPGAERAGASRLICPILWVWSTDYCHPPRKTGRFTGADFPLQPDGTLRCPAGNTLTPQERRHEENGSLRVVYAASIRKCRPCPLREQCQWQGGATKKPRQVSILLHPLVVGPAPLRLRGIGAAESTDAPVCSSCGTNGSRCASFHHRLLLRPPMRT
jgi:Transposase DDE domain